MSAEVSVAVIGAVAVLIASVIGLIVAVTTSIIAKEQKISEFRQIWIDALREECSEFLTLSMHLANIRKNCDSEKSNELLLRIFKLLNQIVLRLNPSKDAVFIAKLEKLARSYTKPTKSNFNKQNNLNLIYEVSKDTHVLLKKEWERVKNGEKRFINFKNIGKFFASTFMVAIYVLFAIALIKSPILS